MMTGKPVRAGFILALCCFAVYNANGRLIATGDSLPARYQPFALLGHQTLRIDPIADVTLQGRAMPVDWQRLQHRAAYWVVPAPDGHLVSLYPVTLPVLVSPLYAPAVAYVSRAGWDRARLDYIARIMEKLTASAIAAVSVWLLYLLLRRRARPRVALLLAFAYAFGTTTWVISSQALWQHGMGQLLVVALLLALTAPCSARRAIAAGLLCGLIGANRPADAFLVVPLGLYTLHWAGRRAMLALAAGAVPVALVIAYNVGIVGAFFGGYQVVGKMTFFGGSMAEGLAGLLLSPTRGLFVFSPFLLFLFLGLVSSRYRAVERDDRWLSLTVAVAVVLQLLVYSTIDWRQGLSWGPRFLTDQLPLLIWLLVPVVVALGKAGRLLFASTVAVSMAIQSVGAFAYAPSLDLPLFAVEEADGRMRAAWEWRNAPFLTSLDGGVAPRELLVPMRGVIDRLSHDGTIAETFDAGSQVMVRGWALAGLDTPKQVGIAVDGGVVQSVRVFDDRPDVRRALPGSAASGWRLWIDTTALEPGEHDLTLYLWAADKGDVYYLDRRTLSITTPPAPDLRLAMNGAIEALRARQAAPGYWLTEYTNTTTFERPRPEMNTYLTSLLVDLLDPLAESGFAGPLARARAHLRDQVEDTGLVRYHGLPDGAGIGTLGCAITPDTDDTALVWRLAPPRDRARLSSALATIDTYRRDDGLYRTWLAPRERYQCLDPGDDPNPADVAIQMHLLQLLLDERPEAGRALCESLEQAIGDDRVWVYYDLAPLVPLLRARELADAGCRLPVPPSREQSRVPGQQIWVEAVQLLNRAAGPSASRPSQEELVSLLTKLATGDFALLKRHPPFLYHNDLSATVPRYYWSIDVGYALWLRLAREAGLTAAPAVVSGP